MSPQDPQDLVRWAANLFAGWFQTRQGRKWGDYVRQESAEWALDFILGDGERPGLWERMAAYDPTRPFAPWFRRCAWNFWVSRVRGRRTRLYPGDLPRAAEENPQHLEMLGGKDAGFETDILAEGDLVRIAALQSNRRVAVVLRLAWREGLPPAEIAARLGAPASTVRSDLRRVRAAQSA